MSNLFNITALQYLDRAEIEIGGEFLVQNVFGQSVVIDEDYMSSDSITALKNFMDHIWWQMAAGSVIVKADYGSRHIDFLRSYVRNAESTAVTSALPYGQKINVRFEFPGFTENTFVADNFEYGIGFKNPALLAAAGIVVTQYPDDAAFSFTNDRECRITIAAPDDATQNYIVLFPMENTTIPKSV